MLTATRWINWTDKHRLMEMAGTPCEKMTRQYLDCMGCWTIEMKELICYDYAVDFCASTSGDPSHCSGFNLLIVEKLDNFGSAFSSNILLIERMHIPWLRHSKLLHWACV